MNKSPYIEYHIEKSVKALMEDESFIREMSSDLKGDTLAFVARVTARVSEMTYKDFFDCHSENSVEVKVRTTDVGMLGVLLHSLKPICVSKDLIMQQLSAYKMIDSSVLSGALVEYDLSIILMQGSVVCCSKMCTPVPSTYHALRELLTNREIIDKIFTPEDRELKLSFMEHESTYAVECHYAEKSVKFLKEMYDLGYYKFSIDAESVSFDELYDKLLLNQFSPMKVEELLSVYNK